MNVPSPLSVTRPVVPAVLMPVTDRVSLVSGSVSLARTLPVVKLVSSSVAKPSAVAVGPSLRPLIVIVTVAVSVPPLPSLIV